MGLEIVRRIRGNVHDTVDISALEDAVIAHDDVQRLRRIKQLAFLHYVFPGASHSRFEHSLGVMQLAGVAWEKLQINQQRLADTAARIPDFAAIERRTSKLQHGILAPTFTMMKQIFASDYALQVLRLAGLLHDIGHPPFSHSGERFLPSWSAVLKANPVAPPYLKDWLQKKMDALSAKGKDPTKTSVRHEVFSMLMIVRVLEATYKMHPHLTVEVDPRDVIAVLSPDVGAASNSPLLGNGLYAMLHELVSGELDIDRMDYLLRDSHECGVVYGIFDAGRILDALCVYLNPEDKSMHIAITSNGLTAFEDYLRARQSMYLQVYFHKTAASAEAMLQSLAKRVGDYRLPADVAAYSEIDEYNVAMHLEKAAHSYFSDAISRAEWDRQFKNLLRSRRLWKRVFEVVARDDDHLAREKLTAVKSAIKSMEIDFEVVSSSSSLTRFLPRGQDEKSQNYLRLIVKDDLEIPRVMPIEDHGSFIENNAKVMMHRIYVEDRESDDGGKVIDAIRRKIRGLHQL